MSSQRQESNNCDFIPQYFSKHWQKTCHASCWIENGSEPLGDHWYLWWLLYLKMKRCCHLLRCILMKIENNSWIGHWLLANHYNRENSGVGWQIKNKRSIICCRWCDDVMAGREQWSLPAYCEGLCFIHYLMNIRDKCVPIKWIVL